MALDSDKFDKIIRFGIDKAKETLEVIDLLISNEKGTHAINRIYMGMHYMMMAAAAKNGVKLSLPDALIEWFQNKLVKEQKAVSYKYSMIVNNAWRDSRAADFEPSSTFSNFQIKKKAEELRDFISVLEEYVSSSSELNTQEVVKTVKNAILITENPKASYDAKESAKKLLKFLGFKLFLTDRKGRQSLDDFKSAPRNSKFEAQFELRYEDAIESNEKYISDIQIMVNELKEFEQYVHKTIETKQQSEQKVTIIPEKKEPKPTETSTKETDDDDAFVEEEIKSNVILSLWDFTELAEFALEHAIHFADASGADVKLLHIVKRTKEIDEATQKLKIVVDLAKKKYKHDVSIIVREGSIFNDISKIANELKADLVILGTHGLKGMQKVTGSWALKVIKETKAPFVVVQAPPLKNRIEKIILPVDHKRGTKKLMNEVKYLTQHFDIKFHVCKPSRYSTDLQKKKGISNYVFVNSYMKQNRKTHEVHTVGDYRNFSESVIEFSKGKEADLIMVMVTDSSDSNVIDEVKLMTNRDKIPIMCVNPRSAKGWTFSTQASN